MMEAASRSDLEKIVEEDDPTPPLGTAAAARPTRVFETQWRQGGKTLRMRKRLDEVMNRIHGKIDAINGDSGKIAQRISPKATQLAREAFKLDDLEEDTDDDHPRS